MVSLDKLLCIEPISQSISVLSTISEHKTGGHNEFWDSITDILSWPPSSVINAITG